MSSFKEELNEGMDRRGWKPVQLAAALSEEGFDVATITIEKWVAGVHEPKFTHGRLVLSVLNANLADSAKPCESIR